MKLSDSRIILYNQKKIILIYRISNNNISLELELNLDYGIENGYNYIVYEIDKDILLIGEIDLFLIDLKRNIKMLQRVNINNKDKKDYHILKSSNGLLIIHFSEKIIIFDYNKNEKKLIKKDEFDIPNISVEGLSELNNENIIIGCNSCVYILNLKRKEINNLKITNKGLGRTNNLIDNYYLISYLNSADEKIYLDIYKIDLKEIKLIQTINLGHPYLIKQFIKLNDNKLIGNDIKGNIYEFNIEDYFHISLKDILKGSDEGHVEDDINIYKYDDNKIIIISYDFIKIWEFD